MSNVSWRFFRAGGFDQVVLTRGDELTGLEQLDQKLWVALACPVDGLEIDRDTLALIDTDGDKRIRAPELAAASKWLAEVLTDPAGVTKGGDQVALSAIRRDTDAGRAVLASAVQILASLGKPDATSIALADAADTAKVFGGTPFNGDGVIGPDAAGDDAEARALIEAIMASVPNAADRTGAAGIDEAAVVAFFDAAAAFDAWSKTGEHDASVMPAGAATPAAAAAIAAVREKVDDYFTRCALIAFDARAGAALNRADADWAALAQETLGTAHAQVTGFPIAHVDAGRPLPLGEGVNPGWAAAIATLRTAAVAPLLGDRASLTAADWAQLKARIAPFDAWSTGKQGAAVEGLGVDKVRAFLAGGARPRVEALLARDLALKPQADGIDAVVRLIRFQRDFHALLENFVNFRRLYDRGTKAAFQAGTLYLDSRTCELVMRVDDPGKHAAMAGLSACYLAYLDCKRRGGSETRSIVAAFTNGDVDYLSVGRNGVFYDRDGNDWDATITRIVENPLSVRQAFFAPYKKVARLVEEQFNKFAAAREAESDAKLTAGVDAAATAPAAPPKPAAFDIAKFAGIAAAAGLAIGALGSAVAMLVTGFMALKVWQMPIAIGVLLLIISGPSMLLAALKLRQRNLAPLLEANGWAINARVRINIPFGRSLTTLAQLPDGAERSLEDPYADEQNPWPTRFVALALLLAVGAGFWHRAAIRSWLETQAAAGEVSADGSGEGSAPAEVPAG